MNENIQYITYVLAIVALRGVLIWGLKLLSQELKKPAPNAAGKSLLGAALSEKNAQSATGGAPGPAQDQPGSFSRLAGAIGAVGIAATFVGIGYWVIYDLFDTKGADLANIGNLKYYFLAGSAMFLPYAFNQLSSVFK
ncbi:MAG TPA: hypothetical protein VK337_10805 [Xanthobacteraceae bacterium]|nr:hypothetical protein [Xanthobacteraceae bacterium]